jgi:hypothetical protein
MPNRTEARPAKAVLPYATGRLPPLRLFSTPLINQMTTSQTRLRTSPIAVLVNRVVRLTFTLKVGVGRLRTPSPPANCIDPSKISTHNLTHRKLILATPYSDWQPPLRM